MKDYQDFLKGKIAHAKQDGFTPDSIHPILKPHQRDIVYWACQGGQRAIFAQFGLGKTLMQLEICRQVFKQFGGKTLIICPLGVKQEFTNDAKLVQMQIQYVRNSAEIESTETPYLITNYERVRDGDIDVNQFHAVSLDEASVLRGYGTKTFQTFLTKFANVRFKFVATATPSPNRFKELIHYAGFLGVMDTGQALTRFFKRDSQKANNLTLLPSMEKEFWLWVSSWAVFVSKPSDLGYSDEGYDLPEIEMRYHRLPVDHTTAGADSWGNMKMFRDAARSLQDTAKEKRESIGARLTKAIEIMDAEPDNNFLLWHHLEAERYAIQKAQIPGLYTVYGSQDIDIREELIIGFSQGKYSVLATKPIIAGSGCNFQKHCHRAIFMGIDHKFNDFIQSVHRIQRFQQVHKVIVDVIYMESEDPVLEILLKKWENHKILKANMEEIVKAYGLSNKGKIALERSMGVERFEEKGKNYTAIRNDTVSECSSMESESVDLIHTSIPFSNHYEYTPTYECFGHNVDDDGFFSQMDFLTKELYRILKPGRIAAIHVKNRIRFGNVTGLGFPTLNPFSHKTVFHYLGHGFQFLGEIIVLTDVVRENNQTYRLGWSENAKDSSKMGVGCPEYVLIFRKPQTDKSKAYADVPVTKDKEIYTRGRWQIDANAFWRSRGDRFFTPQELVNMDMEAITDMWKSYNRTHVYNYDEHVKIGDMLEKIGRFPATFMLFPPTSWDENIWDDVVRMRTLNSEQSKSNKDNHICPLQFDIVERIIERYSNPGELVLDPFGGLMTVPYCAVKMGRKGVGVELNYDYYTDGLAYLRAVEYEKSVPTLFDL